ncbi:HNH endonuclease [Devosia sp.]|uniref:HNH endonuclease n=1 Tax=Devosia sp. TaxID=1871048 RepID=UPI001B2F5B58|nr:HNH endonuclease [Devosia sp.]MBO9590117.1 HNH endonuclease [Devosia sp.]
MVLIRSQFVDLLKACSGSQVLLYQSVRQSERAKVPVGYFASASIDSILPGADGSRHVVFLRNIQKLDRQFDEDIGDSDPSAEAQGWFAAADVREVTEEHYARLISTASQPRFVMPTSGDRVTIPRFRTRRERMRDRKFRERVYRAYAGRCAISGDTLMSLDGLCGLEAAHIVPRLLSPHERASAGILLAPTWHYLFDCGNIVIHDDFRWSPVVEDRNTRGIVDRRLFLPAFQHDWPDLALLQQKRALFGR